MLCDLALAILGEIAPEFERGSFNGKLSMWGSKEGIERQAELKRICGRMPSVPSIVMNERIVFDNIPEMEALSSAARQAICAE
jgi:hypothetical protein